MLLIDRQNIASGTTTVHRLDGYELGAFDFLMKPVRPEMLRAKATVATGLRPV